MIGACPTGGSEGALRPVTQTPEKTSSGGLSVAGGLGFEPRLTESESAVLPLNYPPPGTCSYGTGAAARVGLDAR